MKKTLLLILLIASCFVSYAQETTKTGFAGTFTFSNFTTGGTSDKTGELTGFNDQTGQYFCNQMQVGDILWDNLGNRWEVMVINSSTLTSADVDVRDINSSGTTPFGTGFVSRETANSGLSLFVPDNNIGISQQLKSRVESHNMLILDGLFQNTNGGFASNGLFKDVDTVKLGGDITRNTAIGNNLTSSQNKWLTIGAVDTNNLYLDIDLDQNWYGISLPGSNDVLRSVVMGSSLAGNSVGRIAASYLGGYQQYERWDGQANTQFIGTQNGVSQLNSFSDTAHVTAKTTSSNLNNEAFFSAFYRDKVNENSIISGIAVGDFKDTDAFQVNLNPVNTRLNKGFIIQSQFDDVTDSYFDWISIDWSTATDTTGNKIEFYNGKYKFLNQAPPEDGTGYGLVWTNGNPTWTNVTGGGQTGEANTSSNTGAGVGLAQAKVGVDLPFKSLVEGTGVTITDNGTSVTISNDAASGEANTSSSAGGGVGLTLPKSGVDLPFKSLIAGSGLDITDNGNDLTLSTVGSNLTAYNGLTNRNDSLLWGGHLFENVNLTGVGVGRNITWDSLNLFTINNTNQLNFLSNFSIGNGTSHNAEFYVFDLYGEAADDVQFFATDNATFSAGDDLLVKGGTSSLVKLGDDGDDTQINTSGAGAFYTVGIAPASTNQGSFYVEPGRMFLNQAGTNLLNTIHLPGFNMNYSRGTLIFPEAVQVGDRGLPIRWTMQDGIGELGQWVISPEVTTAVVNGTMYSDLVFYREPSVAGSYSQGKTLSLVRNGDVQINKYPNTRVDTLSVAPANFLYTDGNGVIKSSPITYSGLGSGGGGGEANTATSSGAGVGLTLPKVGVNLPFKSLVQGTGITITDNGNDVTIASTVAADGNGIYSGSGNMFSNGVATLQTPISNNFDFQLNYNGIFGLNFGDASTGFKNAAVQIGFEGTNPITSDYLFAGVYKETGANDLEFAVNMDISGGGDYGIYVNDQASVFSGPKGQITLSDAGNVFISTSAPGTQEGLKYSADYSADFVDRSLVDKAYTDGTRSYNWTTYTSNPGANVVVGAGDAYMIDANLGAILVNFDPSNMNPGDVIRVKIFNASGTGVTLDSTSGAFYQSSTTPGLSAFFSCSKCSVELHYDGTNFYVMD